ncbi:MAG TPA: BTAD domain-containing putative transcriptional regulator [Pyrinomonadaceae bacterium]|nr:BTAD domain-containing putative transcriptional regulator [Pyrinomonadaceae bacterium]
MPHLQVRLFGKFRLHVDSQLTKGLDASKEQELLSYLLIHRDRHHSREALAALLWGDTSTDKSKKYLRQALWHLQSVLESGGADESRTLLVEHDWLRLNSQSHLWSDVGEFERAFGTVADIPGRQLTSEQAQSLKAAADLYEGDLLSGWYQDWCLFERERLQNTYLTILDKLISFSEQHHQYELAQGYATIILRYDPARERAHRQLMHLHYLAGDRTAALRQYESCVNTLRHELGVKPENRTVRLYEKIRRDELSADDEIVTLEPMENAASADVVGRLRQLQLLLSSVQLRIQRDIKALENGLRPGRD